ncbi:unnamed protein product [Leuciscus chuanchicus]
MADSDTCKDENNNPEVEIVPAPAAFKSDVWKHFGFAVSKNAKGEKVVDRQWTMCKHCHSKLRYNTGNTSNMRSHLTTHHPEKFADSLTKKFLSGQKTLKEAFSTTMPHNSARAQEITSMATDNHDSNAIAQMKAAILKDLTDRYQGEDEKFMQESSALDPRFRTLQHLGSGEREDVFERIKFKASQMQQQDQDVLPRSPHPADLDDSRASFVPPLKKHALEDLLGSSFSSNQVTGGIQAEIDSYCKEALVSLSACPLKWWKDNAGRYPILSSLAKTYLCIPATSVPSERSQM